MTPFGIPPSPTPPAPAPSSGQGGALSGLIPYKNTSALIAYYLGVFSLIPCLGVLLGIPAVVLGIIGLGKAAQHPEVKGKVHAWVGIILGAVFALGQLILVILSLLIPAIAARPPAF